MSGTVALNTVDIHPGDDRDFPVDLTDALPADRTLESVVVTPLNGHITVGECTVFESETEVAGRDVAEGKGFYFRISNAAIGKRDLRFDAVLDNNDRLGGTLPLRCS